MAWYIGRLIKDASIIRSSIKFDEDYIDVFFFGRNLYELNKIQATDNFDSDDYNNLLLLEKKINELIKKGELSAFEVLVIKEMSLNKTKQQLTQTLKKNYGEIINTFNRVTDLLALSLGDEFTDQGYINYMAEKYKLTEIQIKKLETYMRNS